jgi:ubiquinone/menaquinone biosynthesis C-methylase UbiE
MNINDAYDNWAETYDSDRNLTRDLDETATRVLLRSEQYASGLELGCGTGKNTNLLSGRCERLLALDLSPGMLQRARQKFHPANVLFAIGDVTKPWPCATNTFELAVCNLILEHVEDLNFIFAEAGRVLKPGGRLYVSELHPFRQYQGTVARFERGSETIKIAAFVHHVSDFIEAATTSGLSVLYLKEWWHETDQGKPPRLLTFMFEKSHR